MVSLEIIIKLFSNFTIQNKLNTELKAKTSEKENLRNVSIINWVLKPFQDYQISGSWFYELGS